MDTIHDGTKRPIQALRTVEQAMTLLPNYCSGAVTDNYEMPVFVKQSQLLVDMFNHLRILRHLKSV